MLMNPTIAATDAELMVRLAGGDDLALNALMLRWRDRVAAFLHRMVSHPDIAADLTQETFVKLYQACHRYRPTGTFSTYLFGIAANLGRNHARWRQRHPAVSLEEEQTSQHQVATAVAHDPSPDQSLWTKECGQAIHAAFQQLPVDLREAMALFIDEELSYAEIAEVVGTSSKAVEMRIYRARQILRELLQPLRA
jgi:RNA polymerase sigma-70 factor (ECF subfamily)